MIRLIVCGLTRGMSTGNKKNAAHSSRLLTPVCTEVNMPIAKFLFSTHFTGRFLSEFVSISLWFPVIITMFETPASVKRPVALSISGLPSIFRKGLKLPILEE